MMKLLGMYIPFPDVILECYMNGLELVNGHLGIWPTNIYKYFDAHGISYNKIKQFTSWVNDLKNKKRGIMSFWNKHAPINGLHTVMVEFKYKKFYIYNAYSNSTTYYTISNKEKLKEYMEGRFIVGYTF